MRIGTMIWVAVLCGIHLFIPTHALKALAENEIRETPSYAGFTDIRAARTCFAIVGNTQGTSPWEFWREKNLRNRMP